MSKTNNLLAVLALTLAMPATAQTINVTYRGDTAVVTIDKPAKYLILPVEEEMEQAKVVLDRGRADDTWMEIRLAQTKTDYCVPFELNQGDKAVVKIVNLPKDAIALKEMRLSDVWEVTNTDYYRPIYHHTPTYGWMNDANGLVYKDGEYHLYFQYNPYGSKWGNMHWGHAVSKDMLHWEQLAPAIARDTLGHIFSGSSVVDTEGCAGFGKNAIVAFYTSASQEHGQIQCLAYSTDNGRTFTKYADNPILTPHDGLADFRDPKVFWYEPKKAWYMIVSADKEMRFYRSHNLIDWTYMSAFGRGYGAQPNQFECPDFFPLTISGKQKWVMIVNINPGCLFGGSATEYFIGDFDGTKFVCDNEPEVVKFLDYGKDHYATVTFSNTGNRVVGVPWMSNWQYANITPIKQYRGANALPREFSLFEKNGEVYMAANVVDEVRQLRSKSISMANCSINDETRWNNLFADNDGAFELEADITPDKAKCVGFDLCNSKGERTRIYLDMENRRLVMDRTESGLTDFGRRAEPHDIEKEYDLHEHRGNNTPMRKVNSVNYKNDFALGTWAPLNLCNGTTYRLDVFVDKCSVEIFVDGGRIAMTNLVFPTEPYNSVRFFSEGGKAKVANVKAYKLSMQANEEE
ncbi:MAG: GH32 C-terminal domain-containing protein [Candidatus Limisoma sp.]